METINSITDLQSLVGRLRKFDIHRKPPEFQFQLPGCTEDENYRYSTYMNLYNKECGCNSGSFVMIGGIVSATCYYFITGGEWAAIGWNECFWLIGITVGSGVAGKIFGLVRARWKMIQLVSSLISNSKYLTVIV